MFSEVKNDLFRIAKRLKDIDINYKLFYNQAAERFEVHNSKMPNAYTLCFIVPYKELDTRVLDYARQTRKENFDSIAEEMNLHNAVLEQSSIRSFTAASGALADMLEYASKASGEVVFAKQKKWF